MRTFQRPDGRHVGVVECTDLRHYPFIRFEGQPQPTLAEAIQEATCYLRITGRRQVDDMTWAD
jgi:hypothetical protein